jgi:HTH-type transcriptional regulator, fmd operon transcriptional regulator
LVEAFSAPNVIDSLELQIVLHTEDSRSVSWTQSALSEQSSVQHTNSIVLENTEVDYLLTTAQLMPSYLKFGLLTERQLNVLSCREKGMSQLETAEELGTTRANVSMIERRARMNVEKARKTLRAYESTLTNHSVTVEGGSRPQEIPSIVLREGDRYGIHIQSNIVDIIRMVKSLKPSCIADGRTTRDLTFVFNQRGKLSLA